MTRRNAYIVLALASTLPRLLVLAIERSDIISAFVDKGDDFARTFVADGTYGFIPGVPSAYTQPLYGFFLAPLYWVFGRHWLVVGLAHVVVALVTTWLVYELARRVADRRVALVAALLTTLHPYLVWHDMHMNRELLDHLLAASAVLLTLLVAERGSWWWSLLLGVDLGLMILGNVRTLFVPVVLAAYIVWRRRSVLEPVLAVGLAAVVVAPWVIRNERVIGCAAITTDAHAFWKANNENTLETLRRGDWIDDVPNIEGRPPSPQDAAGLYEATGRIVRVDECEQLRFYRARALDFIEEHPGEKAVLAAWGAKLLWQPHVPKTEERPGKGTWLDLGRDWAEPLFMVPVYLLALYGLTLVPRHFAALTVALVAYQTLAAMLFIGETRYRAPWDFLLMILAAAPAVQLWGWLPFRRAS